jgi:hypothetical protein
MACYGGPIPVTDDERIVIWKWAKANGIDKGLPIDKVGDAINEHFFGGQAKPEWITDILSGRKTPFKHLADDAWRKQYNRRTIVQQASELSRMASIGPAGKMLRTALDSSPQRSGCRARVHLPYYARRRFSVSSRELGYFYQRGFEYLQGCIL